MVRGGGTTANDGTAPYRRRRPERSLLYRTVQTHLATWLALAGEGGADPVPAHVEREFRRYLECDTQPRLHADNPGGRVIALLLAGSRAGNFYSFYFLFPFG